MSGLSTHRVFRLQGLPEPCWGLLLVVLSVAFPCLVDPDGPAGEVDVGDPQRGELTEPETGADGDRQEVLLAVGQAGDGRELGLGEEAQVGLGFVGSGFVSVPYACTVSW
jgi:hypothetical protein